MFLALTLAALTAVPAQGGQLKITNARMTIGELGTPRTNNKFLPGDILFLALDMTGLPIDANGDAFFKMGTSVMDSAGKVIFKRDPEELKQFTPLGGNSIPARAYIVIGLDQPAGTYTLEVTIEDPKAKTKDQTGVKFEVLKKDFGVVNVYTSYDLHGQVIAPNFGVVGQSEVVQYTLASFERDPKTKQPKIEVQYQFLDEKGVSIQKEPFKITIDSGVPEKDSLITRPIPVYMNRPGKFTVKITATDLISKKKSTYDLPITVTTVQ